MESNQSKIDSLLNNYLETSKKITMLQNTFNDVGRMDIIQNKLIEHFTKDDVLRKLSNKEKRELLTEISSIKGDDRKFIMGFIDMASKNSIIGRLINELTYNQNQTKTLSATLSPEREKRREEIISLARDMLDDVYKPKFD